MGLAGLHEVRSAAGLLFALAMQAANPEPSQPSRHACFQLINTWLETKEPLKEKRDKCRIPNIPVRLAWPRAADFRAVHP
mmetsp:Transcript_14297/g.24919  ORF Transcript_14297/g.24919 Transcript_14297/m.24919 type:complete len:80 (-) Transcript_14297:510-749(-)